MVLGALRLNVNIELHPTNIQRGSYIGHVLRYNLNLLNDLGEEWLVLKQINVSACINGTLTYPIYNNREAL